EHELGTPLTAILGWASMLRTRDFDSARVPSIYESIYRNAQAQAQIVNDLLDVSRIVTGQLKLEPQPTDVCEVVRASLDTVRPAALATGVALVADLPTSPFTVPGDRARVQQVVWNLLSNATKFTPGGGRVTISVREIDSTVTIEVQDTGIGIAPEALPHVFERFWQADGTSTRTHGGLGLGLALARHIVELHAGAISVTSAEEKRGSLSIVKLPALGRGRFRSPSPELPLPIGLILRSKAVIVVDDDSETRELFATILEAQGARVVCAASAAEALPIIQREPVDVMIIDISMP